MGRFIRKQNKVFIKKGALIDGNARYRFSNCLISGIKSYGRDLLLRQLIVDSMNDNKAVFVIQNGNALANNSLRDEFAANSSGRNFFSIDLGKQQFSSPINLFKEVQLDFIKELLIMLMSSYRELSADSKNYVERYLNEVFDLLQYRLPPVKRFTLSSISDFDANWIERQANGLFTAGRISSQKHQRLIDYVHNDIKGDRPKQREYENFCMELQNKDFANLLSGNLTYSQLNSPNYITFLITDYITCPKQSGALLKLFIHRAIYEMQTAGMDTTFVFEDVDISNLVEFRELLRACISRSNSNVYFTLDKTTNFNNERFDPRVYCNSFFVFKQSVAAEAEEWARMSGTHKKVKETVTTSSYDQVYGHRNTGLLGGMANALWGKKQVVTGKGHETIDEFNVLQTEFMNLDELSCQIIINDGRQKYMNKVEMS